MNRLYCDDCGSEIKAGDVYYCGQEDEDDYYRLGLRLDVICQDCFDEERKTWCLPISFTPGGRMLIWGWTFSWLKTGFWRLVRR